MSMEYTLGSEHAIRRTRGIPALVKPLAFFGLVGLMGSVHGTLIYKDFVHSGSDHVNYTVTVEHDTVDSEFDITYNVSAGSPNSTAKLTGFFFDLGRINTGGLPDPDSLAETPTIDNPYTAATLGLTNESNPSGTLVCGTDFGDTNQVKTQGCNSTLNYGTLIIDGYDYARFEFDVGLAWKVNDLTSGLSGSFSIAALSYTLEDWGAIGLRGQATTGSGGSAKEFQLVDNPGSSSAPPDSNVPVPAPFALIGLGGVLLGWMNRKLRA